MGDFPHYFQRAAWPASVAKENQGTMTDDEMYAFLSYFDTKNLATSISYPYITSIGLQDDVCPPHTNIAPYNNCTTSAADKQVVYNAELKHQVNDEWYDTYMDFFESYQTKEEDVDVLWTGSVSTGNWEETVNLSWDKKGKLENALMTDQIRVTLTTTAEGAQVQLSNPNKDWAKFDDDAFANLDYSAAPQTFTYTISAASVLNDIQLTGIIVGGKNITITKVELVKSAGRYDAAAVTIGSDGIATWSSSKALDFAGTGVTPYYASAVTTGQVMLTSITTTWGYQGYIVKGAAGTYDIPVTTEAEYPQTNYLKATADYAQEVAASTTGKYHYIFSKKNDIIGFYKLNTDFTLGAHKAYLETEDDITPTDSQARVLLVFDDEVVTGISNAMRLNNNEEIKNNNYFDLTGRRISQPTKGLYIVNGKKLLVK